MRKYFFLQAMMLVALVNHLSAQNAINRKVNGRILDESNSPLQFASVVLLNLKDSAIVNGATTNEEGQFSIENIKTGNFVIKSSSNQRLSSNSN